LEELKGGSFTISNQGGIGGGHFTPIVNTPELAILGIGRGTQLPRVVNDKIQVRLILPITLAYDHRLIDGANAVRFLWISNRIWNSLRNQN
jgi:pyruvate dehydrogenase E2 component (dihydrolipoamide acetyltransferase)